VEPTPEPTPDLLPPRTITPVDVGKCRGSYTEAERARILGGALYGLSEPMERDLVYSQDATLQLGSGREALGAPVTPSYAVQADDGGLIRCRGFALGIVAIRSECDWGVVEWDGEGR
jgi:hypothetical protein